MSNKSGLSHIKLECLLLFCALLLFVCPSPGHAQLVFGRVVDTVSNNPITNMQIQAYVYPRNADSNMEWVNSVFTDNNGWFTLSNNDADSSNNLNGCNFFFEVNTWESPYVGLYYGGNSASVTGERVVNSDVATHLNVCSGDSHRMDFTLRNGGSVTGMIYEADGTTPINGMRIRASVSLVSTEDRELTIMNDFTAPNYPVITIDGIEYELEPITIEVEKRVFIRDTYTRELGLEFDPATSLTNTVCNYRSGQAYGRYMLEGLEIPETVSGDPPVSNSLILEVDSEESRCGSFFNYQQNTTSTFVPSAGITMSNVDFTMSNGYELIGSITAVPGPSLCNALLGLYRDTTIYVTSANVDAEGNIYQVLVPVRFDKLLAVKGINPIFPDWPSTDTEVGYHDGAGNHLTCDNFLAPYYTNAFSFINLEAGSYRVEYIEDYIYSVHQTFPSAGYVAVSAAQPTGNLSMPVDTALATADLPPPRVFLNQDSGCSTRTACWITGHPPTECPTVPTLMEAGVCADYTSGNNYKVYTLDDRPTHYFLDFFSDSDCSTPSASPVHTVENYSILNWETYPPRKCDCYNASGDRDYFQVRAFNVFNTDVNTNSTSSSCYNVNSNIAYYYGSSSDIEAAGKRFAGIKSEDYLSNTVSNTAGKVSFGGMALEDNNHLLTGKKDNKKTEVPTIQLASLNWVDYLYKLVSNIAGKLSSPWAATQEFNSPAVNVSSDLFLGSAETDPGQVLGKSSQDTPALPNLFLLDYVSSNLPDCDQLNDNNECVGDGLPDYWEECKGLDSSSSEGDNGANGDPDGDGLSNINEYYNGTDPVNDDSDGDGMPDGWEIDHELQPLVNDSNEDADRDGLTNLEEFLDGTDPQLEGVVYYVDADAPQDGTGTRQDPFRTIEGALESGSVTNGSVVKVAGVDSPYTPASDLTIESGVRLIGDGSATTIIDLGGNKIIVGDGGAVIGFTIENPPANGAAIEINSSEAKLFNNILLGSGGSGMGISLYSSSSSISNNLIRGFDSGIYLHSSSPDLHNNIIARCVTAINKDLLSTPVEAYNYLWQNTIPENNLADPLFVDEAGGNFHLQGGSPLRDAGDEQEYFNDIDKSRNDIGPDGWEPYGAIDRNVPFASITSSALAVSLGESVSFDGSGSIDEWGIAEYYWDFGCGGLCDSSQVNPVYKFDSCGDYVVTLTVTDHNGLSSETSVIVKVGQPTDASIQTDSSTPYVNEVFEFTGAGSGAFSWGVERLTGAEETYDWATYCTGMSTAAFSCNFDEPGLYEVILYNGNAAGCVSLARELVTVIDKPDNEPVSLKISPDGPQRKVTVNNPDNPLHGIEVEIPLEAISEETSITISVPLAPPVLPAIFTAISVPFDLGPDGLGFCMPAWLTIPYNDEVLAQAQASPDNLEVYRYWLDDATLEWQKEEVPIVEVDQVSKLLTVEIDHFSSYQASVILKPEKPDLVSVRATHNKQIELVWQYPSSDAIDGFIIERSMDGDDWSPLEVDIDQNTTDEYGTNPINLYYHTDSLFNFPVPTTFHYRVSAYRLSEDKVKIISDASYEQEATTRAFQDITGDSDKNAGGGDGNNNSDDSGAQSTGGGGGKSPLFGCGLIHHNSSSNSGINALIQVIVLFFPLFIFRWRSHRRR